MEHVWTELVILILRPYSSVLQNIIIIIIIIILIALNAKL
jgi:hypothetical protein